MPTAEAGSGRVTVHLKPQAKSPPSPPALSAESGLHCHCQALSRGCQWQPAAAGSRRPARACRVRGPTHGSLAAFTTRRLGLRVSASREPLAGPELAARPPAALAPGSSLSSHSHGGATGLQSLIMHAPARASPRRRVSRLPSSGSGCCDPAGAGLVGSCAFAVAHARSESPRVLLMLKLHCKLDS
jgi:hypothetical protein